MRKAKINLPPNVPIVNDGGIATSGTGEGRLIPVLVVDCQNHKELLKLIYMHKHSDPGDVDSTWAISRRGKHVVYLILKFSRPVETAASIEFASVSRLVLADTIHRARAVYLQPLESGGSVSEGLSEPKVLVEVSGSLPLKWEVRLLKSITADFRRRGMSRKDAKKASSEHLARMRELTGMHRAK